MRGLPVKGSKRGSRSDGWAVAVAPGASFLAASSRRMSAAVVYPLAAVFPGGAEALALRGAAAAARGAEVGAWVATGTGGGAVAPVTDMQLLKPGLGWRRDSLPRA